MKYILSLVSLVVLVSGCGDDTSPLRGRIENYLKTRKAETGVAMMHIEKGDTLTINNHKAYPMQSVYKFHLALAVLDAVSRGRFSMGDTLVMDSTDLQLNTWSPIVRDYPNRQAKLTLGDIIRYTVSHSDNNGCDFLFRLVGGTQYVEDFILSAGVKNVSIKATEDEMHRNEKAQFTNTTTPFAAVELLAKFFKKEIVAGQYRDFLWDAMASTSTGPDRIRGLLPAQTVVAHKTGSSGNSDSDTTYAFNDIGIIRLPDGSHLAIAVLITNSMENDSINARMIADVGKMAYDHYAKK